MLGITIERGVGETWRRGGASVTEDVGSRNIMDCDIMAENGGGSLAPLKAAAGSSEELTPSSTKNMDWMLSNESSGGAAVCVREGWKDGGGGMVSRV